MIDDKLLIDLVTTMGIVESALKNRETKTPQQIRSFAALLKREGRDLDKAVDAFLKREAAKNTMDLPFPKEDE
jgi:hypothetical protein|nr:MAG TPA: hypothetical protein [Caudoviricetes sp.]